MNKLRKHQLTEILIFAFFWLYFSLLYVLLEKALLGALDTYPVTGSPYSFRINLITVVIFSLFTGLAIGFFETFYLKSLFDRRSFSSKLVFKSLFYISSLMIFIFITSLYGNSRGTGLSMFHPDTVARASSFIDSFSFWILLLYIATMVFLSLFTVQVRDNLGPEVFYNFLFGKYHQPKEEKRVFMFVDMKSSTRIAESLGHVSYFKLLNDYYADMTKAIVRSGGEIYQYVGDEVVISWDLNSAFDNFNCIECFFEAKKIFEERKEYYVKAYGLSPGFKAGMHWGEVTTGEIGSIKKDIIFTGDVLNTCARIQSLCNSLASDNLMSEALLNQLAINDLYKVSFKGEMELRGKSDKVKLYSIQKTHTSVNA